MRALLALRAQEAHDGLNGDGHAAASNESFDTLKAAFTVVVGEVLAAHGVPHVLSEGIAGVITGKKKDVFPTAISDPRQVRKDAWLNIIVPATAGTDRDSAPPAPQAISHALPTQQIRPPVTPDFVRKALFNDWRRGIENPRLESKYDKRDFSPVPSTADQESREIFGVMDTDDNVAVQTASSLQPPPLTFAPPPVWQLKRPENSPFFIPTSPFPMPQPKNRVVNRGF